MPASDGTRVPQVGNSPPRPYVGPHTSDSARVLQSPGDVNHPFLFVFGSAGVGFLAQLALAPILPVAAPAMFLATMGGAMLAASRRHRMKEAVRRAAESAAASLAPIANANANAEASTSALAQ